MESNYQKLGKTQTPTVPYQPNENPTKNESQTKLIFIVWDRVKVLAARKGNRYPKTPFLKSCKVWKVPLGLWYGDAAKTSRGF